MSRTVNERIIFSMLEKLQHGTLTLKTPSGDAHEFGTRSADARHGLQADLTIADKQVYSAILRGGDIAFAEMFMEGKVTTSDLPTLLKLFVQNRQAIETALHGRWWGVLVDRLRHVLRGNTKRQARKNIEAHYDLGNDFYKLWLDSSMTYSSALFDKPFASIKEDASRLQVAQINKYQRVLTQLEGAKNILEIGCGWGGFALAATQEGCRVTGLTLSTEQLAFAKERLERMGFSSMVNLKLQDYRDTGLSMPHQYDGIVSIEMFEAVGEAYWPSYFACLARNLRAGGKACIQSIVIRDELFARYRQGTDFIQRYIFPGGMLPSPSKFEEIAVNNGLRVVDTFSFGQDYARTLAVWRSNFLAKLPEVRALGYPEKFIRMWDFYLAYCEAGFTSNDLDVMHFTLERV